MNGVSDDKTSAEHVRHLIESAQQEAAELVGKAAPPSPPREAVPGFEIIEEIGRGGMGVVYKALQLAVVGGKLLVIRLEVDDVQRATTTLERLGPTTFRTHVDELNMGANVEDIIEFAVDSAGRATSFTTESGAYRYHRVE